MALNAVLVSKERKLSCNDSSVSHVLVLGVHYSRARGIFACEAVSVFAHEAKVEMTGPFARHPDSLPFAHARHEMKEHFKLVQ